MAAVVQRVIMLEEGGPVVTQWLCSAANPADWQTTSGAALFFREHSEADDLASRLRKRGEKGFIFAAIRDPHPEPELPLFGRRPLPLPRSPRPAQDWHAGKANCGVD